MHFCGIMSSFFLKQCIMFHGSFNEGLKENQNDQTGFGFVLFIDAWSQYGHLVSCMTIFF